MMYKGGYCMGYDEKDITKMQNIILHLYLIQMNMGYGSIEKKDYFIFLMILIC